MKHRRAAVRLITVLLLVPATLLVVSEGFVRVVSPQPPSYLDAFRRHPDLPIFALRPGVSGFQDTGETRWWLHTDADGRRVAAPAAHAPDERPVVLVLGDSFTFGMGVDYERTFVASLAAREPALRFVNEGVPGYGPVQYRQLLELALARGLRPRAVLVVLFVGNDFQDCIWSKDVPVHEGVLGARAGVKDFVRRRSHLYRLLARTYHVHGGAAHRRWRHEEESFTRAAWERSPLREARLVLRQELARIASLCAAHGIPVRAAVIPPTRGAAGDAPPGLDPELPTREAVTACRIAGIPCVDTTPTLRRVSVRDSYFVFDSHLTPVGHALVAEAIAGSWTFGEAAPLGVARARPR